jgi:hypothetical protein
MDCAVSNRNCLYDKLISMVFPFSLFPFLFAFVLFLVCLWCKTSKAEKIGNKKGENDNPVDESEFDGGSVVEFRVSGSSQISQILFESGHTGGVLH